MNIKILFIFLVLVLIINNSKAKEGLSDEYMTEVSGGLLKKKDKVQMKNKFDPSSSTFEDDINDFAQEKSNDDRAYVVSEDDQNVEDVDASQEATVDQTVDGEDKSDEDKGSGCNDILLFGLLLLSIIYIVFCHLNIKKIQ
jgi:hypothetical protein